MTAEQLNAQYEKRVALMNDFAKLAKELKASADIYNAGASSLDKTGELAGRFRAAALNAHNAQATIAAALMAEREIQAMKGLLRTA